MKNNYTSLLNQITELYTRAMTQMYFWDKRCNNAENEDHVKVCCDIRNEYARESSAYLKILKAEVSQEDIENMDWTAKQTADLLYD